MIFGRNKSKKIDLLAAADFLNRFKHPSLINLWANKPGIVTQSSTSTKEVTVIFPFAAGTLISELNMWLEDKMEQNTSLPSFNIIQRVAIIKTGMRPHLKGVKNIIVVSSAKGGVGKSTTSANLALSLHAQGAKVGLVDADIYGPSLPLMLGTKGKQPITLDGKTMEPVEAYNIYSNSIGYLVSDEKAMVWRGPMASKAFAQLINETNWPNLDYLIVDMPPGTGDVQLSLAQQFPVSAAIVVTTPQDLALADAIKGIVMFEKVSVPVLGIVENMSYHICNKCGHHEAIFGEGGAQKIASQYGLLLLAQIPLHIGIREDIDAGMPTVASRPDSEHSAIYRQMALRIASQLYWNCEGVSTQILITTIE
ncbi:iron-sulfur cluster carrier protein ApbC [Candidatus Enterovibrio escicola]|uniref:Iron-sulfur cluster carrier protein n=1 Tax=Candidatus Enterovibrio escicola TaxID=1927127 RepID=A0A2A5T0V7_9GAMM|nr:iron-sulfur cluster carrier protein ApbC [Candidatus Enterovibrio escacola]PCS21781.1 Scaffold protein for [4Fe-4S] cluster assembly ApbC [Candidatus Enterovibrio escacola]